MTRTVHRITGGGGVGHKAVYYQSRKNGPQCYTFLCSCEGCPDPFPFLNRAAVDYYGMLCQWHAKQKLNAEVFLNDAGATIIRFTDPRSDSGEQVILQTNQHASIAAAKIPRKYCCDPNDKPRAREIFDMIIPVSKEQRRRTQCCNSDCQTIVHVKDVYCLSCAEEIREVDYNQSARETTYYDFGPDGEVREMITYPWHGLRRLPLDARVRIDAPPARVEAAVDELSRRQKQNHDFYHSTKQGAIQHAAALKALKMLNAIDFDVERQEFTVKESLLKVAPRKIGDSIDFAEFQGQPHMHILHISLRLCETFDLSISDDKLMLSPSSALSEESRNALLHGGHSSEYSYASGNPLTVGPFYCSHWAQAVANARQRDGTITADLWVWCPVNRYYDTFKQVRWDGGLVHKHHANMLRTPLKVQPCMIIRVTFHGGSMDLLDPRTQFIVLYADGDMTDRVNLPLDDEHFVATGQGIFTRRRFKEMAREGRIELADFLDTGDSQNTFEVDDIGDEVEITSDVRECLLSERANVLSSMVENGSSDSAVISCMQEIVCDMGSTDSSRALNVLNDTSSSFRSSVVPLALHSSPGVRENALRLLEAAAVHASKNSSPHYVRFIVGRLVEEEEKARRSAEREEEFDKERAKQKKELEELQNEIEVKRQELERSRSSREAFSLVPVPALMWKVDTAAVSPSPPKRRRTLQTARVEITVKFQSCEGDHSFIAKAKVPDSYLRLLSGAVFDSSKKISTATVEKCVRIIASQQSQVFHAKLYPNKHDEVDYKLFQEEMKEIVCWQVTKNVWVYVVAPFVLPQMDVESERMRIVIVKQS